MFSVALRCHPKNKDPFSLPPRADRALQRGSSALAFEEKGEVTGSRRKEALRWL